MAPLLSSEASNQIAASVFAPEATLTLVDYASIFESLALGVAALGAAYVGAKGVKSLLQEEDIKERFKIVRERNFELTEYALNVLHELDQVEAGPDMPMTDDKIAELRKLAIDLEKKSHGSGSVSQTFCYLIRSILDELKPSYQANNATSKLSARRLESFFYDSIASMIYYLDHNIEIPRKRRIGFKNRFLSWRYGMPGKQELAAGSFGVFLSNNSHATASIHKVLERINAEAIYYILLFKYTRNNAIATRKSLNYDAYIPPSLVVNENEDGFNDIFLYGTTLYLIKTDTVTNLDTKEKSVIAHYHDLDRSAINLKTGSGLKNAVDRLKDEISGKSFFELFESYKAYGDGSIRVEIPILKMKREYKKYKKTVKKKLGAGGVLNT